MNVYFAMIIFIMAVRVRTRGLRRERALQVKRNGPVGIGFSGYQTGNAFSGQAAHESLTHVAGDQNINFIQRMRCVWRAFMQ